MAMLAASKRKQKFSVDPRGSSWSRDETKFGQKLLEKMGWSKGRGLGAKEDGRLEHVKITLKDDTRGVGCSKSQADNWIAHQDDFNSLLANLNQNYATDDEKPNAQEGKILSLEEKSKSSKGRVHYQKFTKGKDLSSRKLEDLDCIFGRRKKRKQTSEEVHPTTLHPSAEAENEHCGVKTFTSSDSIQGYFAKKMATMNSPKELEISGQSVEVTPTSVETPDSPENMDKAEDFGIKTYSSSQSVQDYFAQKMAKLNHGNLKRSTAAEAHGCEDAETTESDSIIHSGAHNPDCEDTSEKRKKKKKQKKRKHEMDEVQCAENCSNTELETGEPEVQLKKRKRKTTDEVNGELQPNHYGGGAEEIEVPRKLKKKKKAKEVQGSSLNILKYEPVANMKTELSVVCKHSEANMDTPSKKRVHFRDPITSILGETKDNRTNDYELGAFDNTKSSNSELTVTSVEASVIQNEVVMDDEDNDSVPEVIISSKKKKKSKKKNKDKKVKENVEVKNVDNEIFDSAGGSGDVAILTDTVNDAPPKKKGRKNKKSSDKPECAKIASPPMNDSGNSKADIDSEIRKLVQEKKMDLVNKKHRVDVKPQFVGSNIDKIPGYSSSNLLLMAIQHVKG